MWHHTRHMIMKDKTLQQIKIIDTSYKQKLTIRSISVSFSDEMTIVTYMNIFKREGNQRKPTGDHYSNIPFSKYSNIPKFHIIPKYKHSNKPFWVGGSAPHINIIYMYTYTYLSLSLSIYIYIYIYVCVYIYIYKHICRRVYIHIHRCEYV